MAISEFYRAIRAQVGSALLLMPAVAAVVRDENERILFQQQHDGLWSLPAGAIEPGESPAQSIVREVSEETGLLIRAESVLAVLGGSACRVRYPHGDEVEYVVTVFSCRIVGGLLITSNDETKALNWFPQESLPRVSFPYPDEIFHRSAPTFFVDTDRPT